MNNIKIKFLDFKADELKFCINYLENFAVSLFATLLVIVWRAQISASQTANTISKKDLQGVPSMKFTAKLFSSEILIHKLLCTLSICETSYLSHEEYVKAKPEERYTFVNQMIEELIPPGKAKIMNPRQISDSEDLATHRRGLIAKYRGTLQSTTLYNPADIIIGQNITFLTWEQFLKGYLNYLEYLNIPIKDAIAQFKKYINELSVEYDMELGTGTIEDDMSNLCHLVFHILSNETDVDLKFEDGIFVSNTTSNVTLLETKIYITRNKPKTLNILEPEGLDLDDPFIKAALKRQENARRNDASLYTKPKGLTRKRARNK